MQWNVRFFQHLVFGRMVMIHALRAATTLSWKVSSDSVHGRGHLNTDHAMVRPLR